MTNNPDEKEILPHYKDRTITKIVQWKDGTVRIDMNEGWCLLISPRLLVTEKGIEVYLKVN